MCRGDFWMLAFTGEWAIGRIVGCIGCPLRRAGGCEQCHFEQRKVGFRIVRRRGVADGAVVPQKLSVPATAPAKSIGPNTSIRGVAVKDWTKTARASLRWLLWVRCAVPR